VNAQFNTAKGCVSRVRRRAAVALKAWDYQLHSPASRRRYNMVVVPANPEKPRSEHVHQHHVYAAETTGLLIIAVVLLILILLRYWNSIHQLFR